MWVVTTKGFFSAVEHRKDPNTVIVRARVRKDLEAARNLIEDAADRRRHRIYVDNTADYPYRLDLPKDIWASVVAQLAHDIDYDNFKDAVKARQGKKRASVYMDVWTALAKLEGPPGAMWQRRRRAAVDPDDVGMGEGLSDDDWDDPEWARRAR
jgi:hypothetical protein